jgi:sensor histidine kinase YesM
VHPLLWSPQRVLLFLATCVGLGLMLAGVLVTITPRPFPHALALAAPLAVFYGFACLAAWWICRARPIEGRGLESVAIATTWTALQFAGVLAVASMMWSSVLARVFSVGGARDVLLHDALVVFVVGVPLYLLSAVAHYLYFALEATHAAAERALQAQVGAREAELRALRAQLNPHFLFNSLNSINALVGGDPEGARRMCEGLGDFLRKTLQIGARESVTLGEELALVDRYLAIEQVRFGDRLQVERAIDPRALECALPPLLLQPLAENAVKHGVAGRIEGGTVRIAADVCDERLVVVLENPVDDTAPAREGEGLGLDNVRRRLEVLGGRDASLVVTRPDGRFRVTLALQAAAAEAARA